MLKQNYILKTTGSKTHLRFLKVIFIISVKKSIHLIYVVRTIPFVFRAYFHGSEITSHVFFSSCNIIINSVIKIYLNQHKTKL